MKKVYLAGGMEKRKDGGLTWRRIITPKLEELGVEVINPCLKESSVFAKHGIEPKDMADLSKRTHQDLYMALGKDINIHDCKLIKECDGIIVLYDESVNLSSGTLCEMFYCSIVLGRPVYCIRKVPFYEIPVWSFGNITQFFETIDEVVSHIKTTCSSSSILDNSK